LPELELFTIVVCVCVCERLWLLIATAKFLLFPPKLA
jgi:hypothetical protein